MARCRRRPLDPLADTNRRVEGLALCRGLQDWACDVGDVDGAGNVRIVVAGATGRIGSLTVAALQRDGHEVVPISRRHGVDVVAGTGLDAALARADAVVDTTSINAATEAEAVGFFRPAGSNTTGSHSCRRC